jgi:type II secretory pathway component PulK
MTTDRGNRRRGVALIIALVVLALIATAGTALLKATLSRRREAALEERHAQARWLAEAGLGRARARLLADPAYDGETWEVAAEELSGRHNGSVRIAIAPEEGRADRRRVTVQADYPAGDEAMRARKTRRITLELGGEPGGGR